MRRSPWRAIAFAAALLTAVAWGVVSGWYVSDAWQFRHAKARMELAREEISCGNRSGSPANQQRCRDLAELMSRASQAEGYFIDGVIVFGPVLALLGVAFWLHRGQRGGHKDRPHHHHPSAA